MRPPLIIPIARAVADAPERPSRRTLVKWLAASMALAASGCSRLPRDRIYSAARLPEIEAQGETLYYASACLRGGYAEGVLIGTHQGRPIKVEGNLDHPASLGGSSAAAQAEVLQLWDPDRSTSVWQRRSDSDKTGDAVPSTWAAFEAAWRARPRGALHVLVPPFTSPTLAAQLAALLQASPGSRWYRDETVGEAARARGAVFAFGRALRPVHRFDRARLIVAFGGDPFSEAVGGLRQSADWARARTATLAAGRSPARLVALEITPGLFGARADERWALAPPAIEAVLWQLAGAPGADDPSTAPIAARLRRLLDRHRGHAILVGGPALSAEAHAAIHVLNQRCAAFGDAIALIESPDAHAGVLPPAGSLADLAAAAHDGAVQTLVILGANPLYTAPASLRLTDAIARVPLSVHHGTMRDETAERCAWHLPAGHAFEQWSDARAFDGSTTLLQPAIAPLYDTRSPHELLALLGETTTSDSRDGHALLQAQWRGRQATGDFETFWAESLRRGIVAGSAFEAVALPALKLPLPPTIAPLPANRLWAVFPPDASVGDGERANNGWLQELPRPFTKIAWGNALCLGPRTARTLGLASGDIARVQREGASVEAPVWVQTGHAEGSASFASGFGRRSAGRVGNGVGVDNAPLRSARDAVAAVEVTRLRGGHRFALTQVELDQHARELARVVPRVAAREPAKPALPQPTLYPPPLAGIGPAWGMAIDLDACIGCNVCTIACQAENNIPVVGPDEVRVGRAMHWIRVDTYQDAAEHVITQPVPCMHCENAPCEVVCPVGATLHDSEGLNVQVYNRCIGTRFCSNNCPYKVRRFNFRQYSDVTTETARLMHNPDVTVRDRGVMEKCSYCVQRLSRARRHTQVSGEVLASDTVETACQSACPTRAIHFGDLRDPESDVARAKASPRHYAMLGELGTQPRTTYLARVGALPEDGA